MARWSTTFAYRATSTGSKASAVTRHIDCFSWRRGRAGGYPDLSRCDERSYASHHGLSFHRPDFMIVTRPSGWVQSGERWDLWWNGRSVASIVPHAVLGFRLAWTHAGCHRARSCPPPAPARRSATPSAGARRGSAHNCHCVTPSPDCRACTRTGRRVRAATDPDAAAAGPAPGRGRRKEMGRIKKRWRHGRA
jgi:hypothetical protein